jgi:hypothetical protein
VIEKKLGYYYFQKGPYQQKEIDFPLKRFGDVAHKFNLDCYMHVVSLIRMGNQWLNVV